MFPNQNNRRLLKKLHLLSFSIFFWSLLYMSVKLISFSYWSCNDAWLIKDSWKWQITIIKVLFVLFLFSYTYSPSRGKIIGSLSGTLTLISGIGLLVYFCCFRRCSKSAEGAAYHDPDEVYNLPSPHHQFAPTGTAVTIGGYTPAIDPQVHTYPVPLGPNPNYYPVSNRSKVLIFPLLNILFGVFI